MFGGLLTLYGVNAAVPAFKTLLADSLDIVVDGLEVDLGPVADLDGQGGQLTQTALGGQTLLDLFPCAVLVGINFALAVLGAAALAVDQALGAVNDGADAAGGGQVALGAGVAALGGQGHAVMAGVVQGVAGGEDRLVSQLCHSLDAQAAGDHKDIFGAFGDQVLQSLGSLGLVAQEIHLCGAGDSLAVFSGNLHKCVAIRLVVGFKFLETLVASNDEQVVGAGEDTGQFFSCFQPILGIVFQLLTFLTE